jgi:hypothetical protein
MPVKKTVYFYGLSSSLHVLEPAKGRQREKPFGRFNLVAGKEKDR